MVAHTYATLLQTCPVFSDDFVLGFSSTTKSRENEKNFDLSKTERRRRVGGERDRMDHEKFCKKKKNVRVNEFFEEFHSISKDTEPFRTFFDVVLNAESIGYVVLS